MARILLINGFQPNPVSEGRLNAALIARAKAAFTEAGHQTRLTEIAQGWEDDAEVDLHLWADALFVQFPLNSMGVPWGLKKYLDEVMTAGMDGRLARGDGRSRRNPGWQYGTGGLLSGRRYMLSLTANAPEEAFGDPDQTFFAGRTLDTLLDPVHLNYKFFGLTPLPSFAAFDVTKNPKIEADFARFDAHLSAHFGKLF